MSIDAHVLAPPPLTSWLASSEPMWVFDRETLVFLEVNSAAIERYSYSRQEFLAMTILDIPPLDDIPLLVRHTLHPGLAGRAQQALWRHEKKNGEIIRVAITSWQIDFQGRAAELVLARPLNE
jgi:PAS domain-containing protein